MTNSNGFKILVADDSAVYRKLVEQSLSGENCSVLVATRGEEAREIIGRERPSLVITDWVMPDLSGLEICRMVRAESQSPYTYIIIVTSQTDKGMVVQGLSAGADDYLAKPFDRDELLARVRVGRRLVELQRQIEAKNRQLEELARTDPLTGLSNRRELQEWASRQICGARRHGFALWVALIDLDHFKKINDGYGHHAGDVVIMKFAEILKRNTRSSNLSGRVGGEEFVQVLTHTDEQRVRVALERVRKEFAAEKFTFDGPTISCTASFGATGINGTEMLNFDELLARADSALYRAKSLGRNRIEVNPPKDA